MTARDNERERGAFEAWASTERLNLLRARDGYRDGCTEVAHLAWQARAAASPAASEVVDEAMRLAQEFGDAMLRRGVISGSDNKGDYAKSFQGTLAAKVALLEYLTTNIAPAPEPLAERVGMTDEQIINVAHLFLGTRADNNKDMHSKGRARQGVRNAEKTDCKRGHPLSGENLRISTSGRRHCRACLALWARTKRASA